MGHISFYTLQIERIHRCSYYEYFQRLLSVRFIDHLLAQHLRTGDIEFGRHKPVDVVLVNGFAYQIVCQIYTRSYYHDSYQCYDPLGHLLLVGMHLYYWIFQQFGHCESTKRYHNTVYYIQIKRPDKILDIAYRQPEPGSTKRGHKGRGYRDAGYRIAFFTRGDGNHTGKSAEKRYQYVPYRRRSTRQEFRLGLGQRRKTEIEPRCTDTENSSNQKVI